MRDQLLIQETLCSDIKNEIITLPDNHQMILSSQKDALLEENLFKTVRDFDLTKSETQVLSLIVSGKPNKQIAKLLCRSQRTIEYHRYRLMGKLNVSNTVDLVKCAFSLGIFAK